MITDFNKFSRNKIIKNSNKAKGFNTKKNNGQNCDFLHTKENATG
jgi:hypothetical protein